LNLFLRASVGSSRCEGETRHDWMGESIRRESSDSL
jgi:hypothetical protein